MPVKSHLSSKNTLGSARQFTSNEIKLILKSVNTKKTSSTDKIPTKLLKLESNFLSTPLATAINNSVASCKFPEMNKVTKGIPIYKTTDAKYGIFNF